MNRSRFAALPRHALAAAALAGLGAGSQAAEFTTSGFATLAVGRSLGECQPSFLAPRYGDDCTRYIVDWSHAGIYEGKWSAEQESRLGVQGTLRVDQQLSFTAQVTSRALARQHANLEWLYGEYRITPEWTLQVGRKRLPLYFYSDFQDVGYAYNTVRPSPDVYGWDVVNYNGISLAHTSSLGDWTLRTEALVGRENSRKNPFNRIFYTDEKDVLWSGIQGITAEASHDWLTARVSYVRSNYQMTDVATTATSGFSGGVPIGVSISGRKHEFIGAALNADIDDWIFRGEAGTVRRESLDYHATFHMVSLGYRLGDFTLTGGWNGYREKTYHDNSVRFDHNGPLLALRYEVHKGGALKLQYDHLRDKSPGGPVMGTAGLVTATYDIVF